MANQQNSPVRIAIFYTKPKPALGNCPEMSCPVASVYRLFRPTIECSGRSTRKIRLREFESSLGTRVYEVKDRLSA
jgi:hypothetical protein